MDYKKTNFAEKLKIVLIAVILLNVLHSIYVYKHHIIDMGTNALKSFEGGRRVFMMPRSGGTERLKRFVEELSTQNLVLNMVVFDEDGEIIANPIPEHTPPFMGEVQGYYNYADKNTITIYTTFKTFSSNGRGHMQGRQMMQRHIPDDAQQDITVALVMDASTITLAKKQMYVGLFQIGIIMIFLIIAYVLVIRFIKLHLLQIERLKKAEREAEMGEMSHILAHEIRNPLSSISGLIKFASKKAQHSDIQEILSHTTDEINRLNTIVNDFLTFGKEMQIEESDMSVQLLVEKGLSLLDADFKNRNIHVIANGKDAVIRTDKDKMLQVFFNLLLNALQASPENGTVSIEYSAKGITIKNDICCEIPEKNRLFEPFYTTKTKGSGLGLAVVKRICELLGFQINITSLNPFIVEIKFGR